MDDHRYLILQLCVQSHSQAQVALAERRSICCHTGRPGGELPSAQALGDASNGVGVVVCTAETDDLLDPWPLAYLVEDVGSEGASCAGEDLQMSSESGVRSARNSPRHDRQPHPRLNYSLGRRSRCTSRPSDASGPSAEGADCYRRPRRQQ